MKWKINFGQGPYGWVCGSGCFHHVERGTGRRFAPDAPSVHRFGDRQFLAAFLASRLAISPSIPLRLSSERNDER